MGYERAWIVGDEFVKNTFSSAVMCNKAMNFYMKDHFVIEEFSSGRFEEGNVLSRVLNNVIRVLNAQIIMPKLFVIVLDSDITKNFDTQGQANIHQIATICTQYLIKSLHKITADFKKALPSTAVKYKYPTFLWMVPPNHMNFNDNLKRRAFASSIERTVMMFNEMRFMKLKTWPFDDAFVVQETTMGYRYTGKGLQHYWLVKDYSTTGWLSTKRYSIGITKHQVICIRGSTQVPPGPQDSLVLPRGAVSTVTNCSNSPLNIYCYFNKIFCNNCLPYTT